MKQLPHNWTEFRRDWPALGLYQRFEAFVALVLTDTRNTNSRPQPGGAA